MVSSAFVQRTNRPRSEPVVQHSDIQKTNATSIINPRTGRGLAFCGRPLRGVLTASYAELLWLTRTTRLRNSSISKVCVCCLTFRSPHIQAGRPISARFLIVEFNRAFGANAKQPKLWEHPTIHRARAGRAGDESSDALADLYLPQRLGVDRNRCCSEWRRYRDYRFTQITGATFYDAPPSNRQAVVTIDSVTTTPSARPVSGNDGMCRPFPVLRRVRKSAYGHSSVGNF
jgi:hypothetical protein